MVDAALSPPDGPLDPTVELRVQNARLAAEILSLKSILEGVRKRAESIRVDLDRWTVQAERHALPTEPVMSKPPRWWWFPRFKRKAPADDRRQNPARRPMIAGEPTFPAEWGSGGRAGQPRRTGR